MKRQGTGAVIEVPAPVYATGVLLGLCDPDAAARYWLLRHDSTEWLRARRLPKEAAYRHQPLQNQKAARPAPISEAEVARAVPFLRGEIWPDEVARVIREEGREAGRRAQLLANYINRLHYLVVTEADWRLTVLGYTETLRQPAWQHETALTACFTLLDHRLRALWREE